MMKNNNTYNMDTLGVTIIDQNEALNTNGGKVGDATELIGRSWVWSTAHILTFGISTLYLVAKNV